MDDREELQALRRLAELEAKAGGGQPLASAAQRIEIDPISQGARAAQQPSIPEELARQFLMTGRYGMEAFGGGGLADKMGLPQPQGAQERIVGDTARTMAGAGGVGAAARALQSKVIPAMQPYMQMLGANPGAMQVSAAGGGAASGAAREGGAGPMGQFAAGLAGGLAAPAAVGAAKAVGGKLADMGATIGASFGHQGGTERLARHAAQRVAGETRPEQLAALLRAQEYAPGAKPNVAEALAQAQAGQPTQMGGATIKLQKDLTGAKGIEDVLPSAMRTQRNAIADHLRQVKAETKPMRTDALNAANAGGVKIDKINAQIDKLMATPGNKADDLIQKTLGAVKEKLVSLADDAGNIDARELYTVRKKLGNTIASFSRETANWDKKQTAGLEREVQKLIDDAIEGAGGTDWRKYLSTYSAGMKVADTQKTAAREAKLISALMKGSHSGDLASGELPKLPTLLSRPMMATNFALKMLSRDANTPVAKMLAEKMSDPQAYAQLLRSAPKQGTPQDAALRAALAAALAQQGGQQ